MLRKPESCSACPLYKKGLGFVLDTIPNGAKFVMLGEAPGKTEIIRGEAFVGDAGFVLWNWGVKMVPTLQLAKDQGLIGKANVLRCLPPKIRGRAYPQGEERRRAEQCCRQYDRWPEKAVFFLLGEYPQHLFFHDELRDEDAADRQTWRDVKGVLGRVGRELVRGGRRFIFVPHPSFVLRSPATVETLQEGLKIGVSNDRIEVQDRFDWDDSPAGLDMEWTRKGQINVLGLAQDAGLSAKAWPVDENSPVWLKFKAFIHDDVEMVGHNLLGAGSDYARLRQAGVKLPLRTFDTMLAMHACNGHLAGAGLLDIRSVTLLLGEQDGKRFPLDWKDYAGDVIKTCREDAAAALWNSKPLRQTIDSEGLQATFDVSQRVAPIFVLMHERGVKLDVGVLETIHKERQQKVEQIIAKYGLTEHRAVTKGSPERVYLKRPKLKNMSVVEMRVDESGEPYWFKPATPPRVEDFPVWRSDQVLEKFKQAFGFRPRNRQRATWEGLTKNPRLTEEARDFATALVQLGAGANDAHWLGQVAEDEDGISFEKVDENSLIRPEYHIHGSPDRPIAKRPNIQNFPRPADDPRSTPLRASVIPFDPSEVLVSVDFSSVETYTSAVEAGDWDMVRAVQLGERSHERIAEMFSQDGRELSRQQGKTINHAFDKGESPHALAKRLFGTVTHTQKDLCNSMYQALLARYPRTAQFRDDLWERARENPLTVRNSFGRRLQCFARSRYGEGEDWDARHQPGLKYWCPCRACAPRRERWKYAIAFLGRSSAVDVLLRVMIRIWEEKRLDQFSLPLIECHDELVFSIGRESAMTYSDIAKRTFEEPVEQMGGISLPAEAHVGNNWGEAKEAK